MKRRDFETLLLTLESTPALLSRAAALLSPAEARRRPAAGGFSFVENVWHLADLERDGYGVRIRRILAETEPALLNFHGERIARERAYQERDVDRGHRVLRPLPPAERRGARALSRRRLEARRCAGGCRPRHARRHPAHDGRARPRARPRDRGLLAEIRATFARGPPALPVGGRLTGPTPRRRRAPGAGARRLFRHSPPAAMSPGRIERKTTTTITISMCSLHARDLAEEVADQRHREHPQRSRRRR